MELPHKERIRFCSEASRINQKMNTETNGKKNIFEV